MGSKQRFYVAAQGPTRLTLPHFWQCVWEAEVYLLVQLTDPTEDLNYLPDANERCIDIGQVRKRHTFSVSYIFCLVIY